jgi:hypothetical protein
LAAEPVDHLSGIASKRRHGLLDKPHRFARQPTSRNRERGELLLQVQQSLVRLGLRRQIRRRSPDVADLRGNL